VKGGGEDPSLKELYNSFPKGIKSRNLVEIQIQGGDHRGKGRGPSSQSLKNRPRNQQLLLKIRKGSEGITKEWGTRTRISCLLPHFFQAVFDQQGKNTGERRPLREGGRSGGFTKFKPLTSFSPARNLRRYRGSGRGKRNSLRRTCVMEEFSANYEPTQTRLGGGSKTRRGRSWA